MSNAIQLPNGDVVELTGGRATADNEGNLIILASGGQTFRYAGQSGLLPQIATALSATSTLTPTITSVLWSTDDSTWTALPAPANTTNLYFQINGTYLGSAQNTLINGVGFSTKSVSSTQVTAQSPYSYAAQTTNIVLSAVLGFNPPTLAQAPITFA